MKEQKIQRVKEKVDQVLAGNMQCESVEEAKEIIQEIEEVKLEKC